MKKKRKLKYTLRDILECSNEKKNGGNQED